MTISKIVNILESKYPLKNAEEWDSVGLQRGNDKQEIENVLVCLDITNEVLDYALEYNCGLIVSHHPLEFKSEEPEELTFSRKKLFKRLENNRVSIYSLHTNYDSSSNGMSFAINEKLKLINTSVLDSKLKMGLIGDVYSPKNMEETIKRIKNLLNLKYCEFIGNLKQKEVKTIAIMPGAGKEFAKEALRNKVDLFITSDVNWHTFLYGKENSLNILKVSHFIEKEFIKHIAALLKGKINTIEYPEIDYVTLV